MSSLVVSISLHRNIEIVDRVGCELTLEVLMDERWSFVTTLCCPGFGESGTSGMVTSLHNRRVS